MSQNTDFWRFTLKRFVRIEVGRKGPSMKVFVYCTLLMLPMAYPAYGAILITAPVVRGSIQDLPVDGNPDSIANTSNIVTSNDAANGDSNGVAEFDISSLTGPASFAELVIQAQGFNTFLLGGNPYTHDLIISVVTS